MQDIAAPLYAQLLADAAQRLGPSPAFYSLWPASEPSAPWTNVAAKLFSEVSRRYFPTLAERFHDCVHELTQLEILQLNANILLINRVATNRAASEACSMIAIQYI